VVPELKNITKVAVSSVINGAIDCEGNLYTWEVDEKP